MTIGEVARAAGLRTSAIRYYESIGVLPEAERHAGQRRYGPDTLQRLRVIEVAKQAGFSLGETRALLAADADSSAHAELRALAARKLPEIDALIERAQRMRDWLTTASDCGCETLDVCALFEPVTPSAAGSARTRLRAAPMRRPGASS